VLSVDDMPEKAAVAEEPLGVKEASESEIEESAELEELEPAERGPIIRREEPATSVKRPRQAMQESTKAMKKKERREEVPHKYVSSRPHRMAKELGWRDATNWKLRLMALDEHDSDVELLTEEESEVIYKANIKRLMDDYDEGFDEAEVLQYRVLITQKFVDGVMRRIPQSYGEAVSEENFECFGPAIESEVKSYLAMEALDLDNILDELPIDPRTGQRFKAMNMKWVFDIKVHEDGSLKKYKARLTGKGFMQRKGESYDETYAPTASKESIKILLAIAAMYGLPTVHIDVSTAFLNGVLPEEDVLYVRIPDGFGISETSPTKRYCRVLKAIYGTKQASRIWYMDISETLISLGFKACESDPCMFIKWCDDLFVLLVLYVDDVFVTGSDDDGILEFERQFGLKYDTTNLGAIKQCLGAVVTRDKEGNILLNNEVYFDNLFTEFHMREAKESNIPATPEDYLHQEMCPREEERDFQLECNFRSVIGSLMFAAVFWRLDIAPRVNHLARFLHCAGRKHYMAAMMVLRYLKHTMSHGLFFKRVQGVDYKNMRLQLVAYCDANFSNDADAVSTTGGLLMLTDKSSMERDELPEFNCIMSISKRQTIVAQSTGEAEWVAANKVAKEVAHKTFVLEELGLITEGETKLLLTDSEAAVKMGDNWKVGQRTRHMNKIFHYVRHQIMQKKLLMRHVAGEYNLAAMLTKFLARKRFEWIRDKLMCSDLSANDEV